MSLFAPAPDPPTELGRFRVLSSTAGVRCSPLALGAMSIGSAWQSFMGSMSKEDSFKLLDAYHDAGGNFIDTANNYQDEQSETWIGEWMQKRKNRDLMVIATKYTTPYKNYELGNLKTPNYTGNSKKTLHLSLRDSLKKLQTDYIDILYVHWWDWTCSITELMDSLHIIVEQGKVLYLGASDMPAWIVSACNEYAKSHGKTQFSVYQGRYNLLMRDFERDIIPMARHYGMALCPWDAIGGGRFQSRKAMEERKKAGEGIRTMLGGPEQTEDEVKVSEALAKVADEHGGVSVTAVALAYVFSKSINVFPLVGGRKVEHLYDNIKALSIRLTPKQIEELESVKPFDIGFPMNFVSEDPHVTGKAGFILATSSPIVFNQAEKPPHLRDSA